MSLIFLLQAYITLSPNLNCLVHRGQYTIQCTGKCTIITHEPFKHTIFKKTGGGEFVIKVDPTLSIIEDKKIEDEKLFEYPNLPDESRKENGKKLYPVENEESFEPTELEIEGIIFTIQSKASLAMANAIQQDDFLCVKSLLDEAKEFKNNQALLTGFMLMAGLYDKIAIVEEFIRRGANVNGTDNAIPFPQAHLITACMGNHVEFVKALLQAGANPNVKTWRSETPLMFASDRGYVEIVKALLAANAEIQGYALGGITALKLAQAHGHSEIVELLTTKHYSHAKKLESTSSALQGQEAGQLSDKSNSGTIKCTEPESVAQAKREKIAQRNNIETKIRRQLYVAVGIVALSCLLPELLRYIRKFT